jgi:hypothetical protein
MNFKMIMLSAALVASQTAFAQTTTTASAPAAAATNANTATVATPAADTTGLKPVIKYLGFMHGPGMDFSGAQQAGVNGDSTLKYENRFKFLVDTNPNTEFGIEARVSTYFGKGEKLSADSGNWRLMSNFKHVYKDDIFDLTLSPRIMLPTSNKYRNQKATLSPDMIVEMTAAPKNSRFSFDSGIEYIWVFHTDGATGSDYSNADTAIVAPWLETDYQLTEKSQLMISYWPGFAAQARNNAKLTSAFAQDGGNEIDVGGYYEIAKGWQFNPYVAIEMSDYDKSNALKNYQANFLIIGQIL